MMDGCCAVIIALVIADPPLSPLCISSSQILQVNSYPPPITEHDVLTTRPKNSHEFCTIALSTCNSLKKSFFSDDLKVANPFRNAHENSQGILILQSHPPATGVLKWEILGSALPDEVLPRVLSEIGVLWGGCSQECSGRLGVHQGVLPSVLNVGL